VLKTVILSLVARAHPWAAVKRVLVDWFVPPKDWIPNGGQYNGWTGDLWNLALRQGQQRTGSKQSDQSTGDHDGVADELNEDG
jgi:hypothetical protein